MTGRARSAGVRRIDLSGAAFGGRFADAGYARAFEVMIDDPDALSPEQWVRRVFEGAPRPVQQVLLIGWKLVLGLRLGPLRSPAYVLGWQIADTCSRSIDLQVQSVLMTAHKVLLREDSRLVLATFIVFKRPWSWLIWSVAAPIHHRAEPYLLARATNAVISS